MTVVVGLTSITDAFVIADCRLSWDQGDTKVGADVCQKIVLANAWSVVGFAGDLCLARHLMKGVASRLRATHHTDPAWLKDDGELRRYLAGGIANHARIGPGHDRCQAKRASLLIAWMDWSRSLVLRSAAEPTPPFLPGAEVLTISAPDLAIRRVRRGLDVIGSGRKIAQAMRDEAFEMLSTFGRYGGDAEITEAHRALIATQVIRDLLRDKGGDAGVGGLYKVAVVSARNVRALPYFYLAHVEPGFRTYVAMRAERGEWVQEHRPTGSVVKVLSPFAFNPFGPARLGQMFDPAAMLTRDSPGVVPARPSEVAFALYDPDDVPPDIRTSWGDEPLAPLSWGPEFATADSEPKANASPSSGEERGSHA